LKKTVSQISNHCSKLACAAPLKLVCNFEKTISKNQQISKIAKNQQKATISKNQEKAVFDNFEKPRKGCFRQFRKTNKKLQSVFGSEKRYLMRQEKSYS